MDGMSPIERWFDACELSDIPVRGSRRLRVSDLEIAIIRNSGDEVYAINNKCPHKNGPLSEGIVHDHSVTCPLHNWVFDLKTGQAQGTDSGCVRTYDVELRGSRVFVKVATA